MTSAPVAVDAIRIDEAKELDPIHVFWVNVEPGQGYATIICYGAAWTVYFGGMSGKTIQQFFLDVDVDYLVNKLNNPQHLKQGKKQDAYLGRIVEAIQLSLRAAK